MAISQAPTSLPPEWLGLLACPRDGLSLQQDGSHLVCSRGHAYPIVEGVPVLLVPDRPLTIDLAAASWHAAESGEGAPLYLDTIGVSPEQRSAIRAQAGAQPSIDPVVSQLVAATSGYAYSDLVGRLGAYPVPGVDLPQGRERVLMDVGCSWGRWSVAAARKGWRVLGLDPSLGALLAARRAFGDFDGRLFLVCGDARFLPVRSASLDAVYSYSVIQHFAEEDAKAAFTQIGRALRPGGFAKLQMAQKWGMRSVYHWTRPGYAQSGTFRVRYWTSSSLLRTAEERIGPARIRAEAFGGLGLLRSDWRVLPIRAKLLIAFSEAAKGISNLIPALSRVADSVFVVASKCQQGEPGRDPRELDPDPKPAQAGSATNSVPAEPSGRHV